MNRNAAMNRKALLVLMLAFVAAVALLFWSAGARAEDRIIAFYLDQQRPIVLTELCPGNALSSFGGTEVRVRCPKEGEKTPPIWFTVKCTNITVDRSVPGRANVHCKCLP